MEPYSVLFIHFCQENETTSLFYGFWLKVAVYEEEEKWDEKKKRKARKEE